MRGTNKFRLHSAWRLDDCPAPSKSIGVKNNLGGKKPYCKRTKLLPGIQRARLNRAEGHWSISVKRCSTPASSCTHSDRRLSLRERAFFRGPKGDGPKATMNVKDEVC